MTVFDLLKAIGNADDELLEDSECTAKPVLKAGKILPWLSAAACIGLIAAVSVYVRNDDIASKDRQTPFASELSETSAGIFSETSAGIFSETPFETSSEISLSSQTPTVQSIDNEEAADVTLSAETAAVTTSTCRIAAETQTTFTEAPFTESPESLAEETSVTAETAPEELLTTADLTDLTSMEEALIPRWEDMSDMERFTGLRWRESEYIITTDKFDSSELTFSPFPGEIFGYDEYSGSEFAKPIAVYTIGGVNENYMAAVLTADGEYTGFVNYRFKPANLEDFLSDTDFYARHAPARLFSGDVISASEHMEYTLPDLNERIESLLALRKYTLPEPNPADTGQSSYALYDSSGRAVMFIYGSGYVTILGETFNIGEDVIGEFSDYVEENAEKSELVRYGAVPSDEMVP
ncbi:MAG: hypothetical protein NC078_05670, partial [Ruminococcus sp.]|nr:hypothetical protein [Ruminococcus sp.]